MLSLILVLLRVVFRGYKPYIRSVVFSGVYAGIRRMHAYLLVFQRRVYPPILWIDPYEMHAFVRLPTIALYTYVYPHHFPVTHHCMYAKFPNLLVLRMIRAAFTQLYSLPMINSNKIHMHMRLLPMHIHTCMPIPASLFSKGLYSYTSLR